MKYIISLIMIVIMPFCVFAEENIIEVTGQLIKIIDGKEQAVTKGKVEVRYVDKKGNNKLAFLVKEGGGYVVVPGWADVKKDGTFNVRIDIQELKKLKDLKIPMTVAISYERTGARSSTVLKTKEGHDVLFKITDNVKKIDTEKIFGKIIVK